jgi:GntR family transcriptional regulator
MPRPKTEIPKPTQNIFSGVNFQCSVAVYVQIENLVLFGITAGHLKPGDSLPSIMDLAERFEVNPNTIAKAYRDLEVMGILYSRRGMGVYITKNAQRICSEKCRELIIGRLYEVAQESLAAGISKAYMQEIVSQCLNSDTGPYEDTPATLLKLAKKK